jgi:hypothetical protein
MLFSETPTLCYSRCEVGTIPLDNWIYYKV